MDTTNVLAVATLGRQLHLGMLYDCCNDSFIPGVYLWDMDKIEKNRIVSQSPQTSFKIVLSDSLEEKEKMLQISSSLSASVHAALVNTEGSASYLNDSSSSMHECRVTVQYSVRTKTEHLNLSQMGSAINRNTEDPDFSATHVVIQVEYGAEALMVFSESASDEQKKQDIQASMKLMVNNIGLLNISAEGKVQMTDEERKKVQNFNCTFHGDFVLENNPANFEEAVKVYKELHKLLGPNKENVVPKKVWLVPLKELVPSAPEVKHKVSEINCIKLRNIMEQLNSTKMRANDISKESDSIRATDITKKMKDFGENLQKYMLVWKDNLFKLLPKIRKGAEKEERLEKMFSLHEESPFGPSKMDAWLKERETELSVVKTYIKDIQSRRPNVQIVAHEDLDKVLFDPNKHKVGVFGFNSLGEDDPYLDSLRVCLDSEKFTTMECLPSDLQTLVKDKTPWYRSPEVSQTMRDSFDKFCLGESPLSSLVSSLFCHIISYFHYPYIAGASVRRYSNGTLFCINTLKKYEVVDISANTITLRQCGDSIILRVICKKSDDGGDPQEQNLRLLKKQILVISDLLPNTKYEIQVFSEFPPSEVKHVKPFTFVTKPN
ncbi:stonustoxin subunit beta-like isoform X2 [Colossoma macropomum]|uniref:stonustoxin subunit beta-like isoform X2 n=1 Tax=Colossoma macropomum TaxID=42526 RepID=UPI001863C1A1|nr:stonustoxin subunit beta-like isoform X2 [Colossoma macropomum]